MSATDRFQEPDLDPEWGRERARGLEALTAAIERVKDDCNEEYPWATLTSADLARMLVAADVRVLLPKVYVTDPGFHRPSYDQGFRDGESDVVADYQFALTEIPGYEWPEGRGFYPADVARTVAELLTRQQESKP